MAVAGMLPGEFLQPAMQGLFLRGRRASPIPMRGARQLQDAAGRPGSTALTQLAKDAVVMLRQRSERPWTGDENAYAAGQHPDAREEPDHDEH